MQNFEKDKIEKYFELLKYLRFKPLFNITLSFKWKNIHYLEFLIWILLSSMIPSYADRTTD